MSGKAMSRNRTFHSLPRTDGISIGTSATAPMKKTEIWAPALIDRVEAINPLRELVPNERPAGSDAFAGAGVAIGACPHGVDQAPFQRVPDQPEQKSSERDCQQAVERRREQVLDQPATNARFVCAAAARAALPSSAHRRSGLSDRPCQRSTKRMRELNQFMNPEVSRLRLR